MLCEKCKKNDATFYYHENVNGKEKTYRLCGDCAKELEMSGEIEKFDNEKLFSGFDSFFEDFGNPFKSMDKLLSGFFGGEENLLTGRRGTDEDKKCPSCGMTFREFSEKGMAGCPMCYDTFASELEPTISSVHGRTHHTGRVPVKFREKLDLKHKIESLEKEQRDAVKSENYERAAEIRDQLKTLRAGN